MQEQSLQVTNNSIFSADSFEHNQRIAKMLSVSSLIPKEYQGKIENVMIAMEMSTRAGASPIMVMQNLHVIQGKPSWSSSFIIAMINTCGKFTEDLDFEISGEGMSLSCYAFTYAKKDGKLKKSPTVTMQMAKAEGWLDKSGSKWKTMPDLMIQYRAAAFFGRLHVPELMMGMQTSEEVRDVPHVDMTQEIYTIEDLKALLDEKIHLLTKAEFDNANRIIDKQEVNSFKKLHKLLTEKKDDDTQQA